MSKKKSIKKAARKGRKKASKKIAKKAPVRKSKKVKTPSRAGKTELCAFSCPADILKRFRDFCAENESKVSPMIAIALDEFLDRNAD